MRTFLLVLAALVTVNVGCQSVRALHDETVVTKDVGLIVREERLRENFETRLKQYGFDIQCSSDKSECEALLCLDDHCRWIFVLTYKVDSTETVHAVKTNVLSFRSISR